MISKQILKRKFGSLDDILLNYTRVTSPTDRFSLLVKSAVGALSDPKRADLVSDVGDLSGEPALTFIERRMKASPNGLRILQDKPRITGEGVWDPEYLLSLDENTFGFQYADWMRGLGYSAKERPLVKYVQNIEHAYIMQRYRETHDMYHVLLGYGTSVEEELAVKWFEMVQTGLPVAAMSAFAGPMGLMLQQGITPNRKLMEIYLPHIVKNTARAEFLMNVYFEEQLTKDIKQLRRELGLFALQK